MFKRMRFSVRVPRLPRVLSCLCLTMLTMALLLTWTLLRHSRSFTQTCHHSEAFQDGLHALGDRVHRLLVSLGLTHFLCYGSLWGQLRLSRTLPWERDIELCVLNEEMALKDEVFLERQFRKNNMQLAYDSTDGKYTITDDTLPDARVELIVFEEDPMVAMLRRVGWKRRVLPSDCESLPSLSCFPPRLIKTPLPSREFGGYIIPVPREGIEIQKYHYPDNWWKEVLPKNC
ncbi:uncharacterized protein LOC124356991 [Homalodisca vitripennis]|uniref:uncharacterized protein LOC124356991 n=1 Tax=Homalodisca vitripennis TaxID=197043 RepID=UPI001EE9EE33|nr:uncharacterized protein LOC124356991 [Homalodisca vitripennis]KAG8259732.1 hypothetical protein J6590_008767 [Homalodisca vitripennis]